jgi:AcrR family transcriptional regulator
MRVTAKVKEQTHAAILAAARRLFLKHGLDATSTRDIAKAARVATGTVFNYFPTKHDLAHAIASGAFDSGRDAARERIESPAPGSSTLEMDLFTLIASDLRALADLRGLAAEMLEGDLGRMSPGGSATGDLRSTRLEDASWVLARHGLADHASAPLLHLYWSLYLGVLTFWSRDGSPRQEDTLALLDQAIKMFIGAVAPAPHPPRSTPVPTAQGDRP